MSDSREWLEADGLGGFASGTVGGVRTRRYHALLLPALPTGRVALVNGFDAWLETSAGTYALSSHAYPDGVEYPNGSKRLEQFEPEPWPTWTFRCEDGTRVRQEIFAAHETGAVCVAFTVMGNPTRARLTFRPFMSGRDYHALHHENPACRMEALVEGERLVLSPYASIPAFVVASNGAYRAQADWYRHFVYAEERARGLDFMEDLATPGTLTFDLTRQPGALLFATKEASDARPRQPVDKTVAAFRANEAARRRRFTQRLHRAADAYVVRREGGKTLIAGYPWFTDWGRDTFISLRGLCLATGRFDDAEAILTRWAGCVSEGMLPNRFADDGNAEFNSVDASLWFIVAAHEFLALPGRRVAPAVAAKLRAAIEALLSGYAQGTRHGIRADADGLLSAGEPGVALTWMDARVGNRAITPRIGKPVEVQALWLNGLAIGAALGSQRWRDLHDRGLASFAERFWNAERHCLYDVVDVDHRPGTVDAALRPNQLFAVGGLPQAVLEGERARAVVDAVEAALWTPMGPRSLAPSEPGYAPHYGGGAPERDEAYHQGTVWPWLAGPFIEAWIRVRGDSELSRRAARERFLPALRAHLDAAGLGHVSELADAEAPHAPRGCPFQAWSTGELLRIATRLEAP
jgi:predicted glycogen debranching enzyme